MQVLSMDHDADPNVLALVKATLKPGGNLRHHPDRDRVGPSLMLGFL
jgi:hypothetical protein